MDLLTADGYWIARWLFERALAAIYLIAFIAARNQFAALLGERGLTPIRDQLRRSSSRTQPSLFHWHYSDRFFRGVIWTGILLSGLVLAGVPEHGPIWIHMLLWLLLWFLYFSIVNVGGRFYGFGWEHMTLEAGFFAAFLGPAHIEPSFVSLILLRWLLFRVEFGAGLIKLRHDPCWRNLTCLDYHYETQPLPNPLSWYFHRLPKLFHRASVLGSHVVQIAVPFGLFAPQPVAGIAAGLIMFHQLWLIVSGNYAWLNWLTLILAIPALPDAALSLAIPLEVPVLTPRPAGFDGVLIGLAVLTVIVSIPSVRNFFSSRQRMNASFNRLHLGNAYGAFGAVTKERYEIVIEGTKDPAPPTKTDRASMEAVSQESQDESAASTKPSTGEDDAGLAATSETAWREYAFRAKPGDPSRLPPQIAPYHLRIDWMMWFLPLSAVATREGVHVPRYERWFMRFLRRLLEGDEATLKLLRKNPFPTGPPRYVRARFYRYAFTTAEERRQTGNWWKRTFVGDYLTPVSLEDLEGSGRRV